jgi:hypothetical protein
MLEIQMSQGGNTIRSIQYHVALAAILKRGDDWWIAQYSTLLDTGDERTSALVVMTFMFQQIVQKQYFEVRDRIKRFVHGQGLPDVNL